MTKYHIGGIVTSVPNCDRLGWFLNPRTGQMQELYEWQRTPSTPDSDVKGLDEVSPPTAAQHVP